MEKNGTKEPRKPSGQNKTKDLYKVIGKVRNTQTNKNIEQRTSDETQIEGSDQQSEENLSSHSNGSIDVTAINFKKYLGVIGVRYIQMGQASHVQNNNEWNLEETVRQAEQKFATDLKTIAMETTNDDKLCIKAIHQLTR